jgi:probable phosphoglycerate mutase
MLIVHFIRHAQSTANITPEKVGGQQNHVELTDHGRMQAKKLGDFLAKKDIVPEIIISSSAIRAQTTADIATKHLNMDVIIDDRIVEMSRGEWEGQRKEDVYVGEFAVMREQESLDLKAPGGENIHEVITRNKEVLDELTEYFVAGKERHIFWFGHGRALRALIGEILGNRDLAYKSYKENTSRSVFVYDGEHWRMKRFNDTSHLQEKT